MDLVLEYDNPAYAKKPAWHNKGVTIPEGDLWKLDRKHILVTSGMAFNVLKLPVFREYEINGQKRYFQVPGFYMTVRDDLEPTNPVAYMGQVGEVYQNIQNADLRDFALALAETESSLNFETAGTLKNGKLAWMLAKCPQAVQVLDDKQYDYLLLSTSHDGTQAFVVALTRIRVVCWNTLSAAINETCTPRYVVRHSEGATWKLEEAKTALRQHSQYGAEFTNLLTSFAKQAVDKRFVEGFLQAMIPGEKYRINKKGPRTLSQAEKKREEVRHLIYGGQLGGKMDAVWQNGNPTAYGVLSGFTQWGETDRTIRCTTQADGEKKDEGEARMESVLFGSFARDREVAVRAISRNIGLTGEQPVWDRAELALAGTASN